jgi:hypothetical protein
MSELIECPHCGDITEQETMLAEFTCGACDRPFSPQKVAEPAYVVAGVWRDEEWIALSRETQRPKTEPELRRLIAGPRRHPFGPNAYQVMKGGECLIYPDKAAADV